MKVQVKTESFLPTIFSRIYYVMKNKLSLKFQWKISVHLQTAFESFVFLSYSTETFHFSNGYQKCRKTSEDSSHPALFGGICCFGTKRQNNTDPVVLYGARLMILAVLIGISDHFSTTCDRPFKIEFSNVPGSNKIYD